MTNKLRIRLFLLFFGFSCIYLIILFNLFLIQVWNRQFFINLAEQQYHVSTTQLPERGTILDRTGTSYLARNRECFSAFIIPQKLKDYNALHTFLVKHFPHAAQQLTHKKNNAFMYIKRRLTDDEKDLITTSNLPDIHLLQESSRFYPLLSACPLIGFTDIDNRGAAGIELQCNEILTGKPNTYHLEKDARSGYFYFKKELQEVGYESTSIQLTIDSNLQFLIDEELAACIDKWHAQDGAIIVMDPQTGDILAMSSYPYVNPTTTHSFNIADTKHKVIADAHELGSVIKVFAALAALEENVVTADELIDCKNSKTCIINGRTINTWKPHGVIPFSDVIAYSNNIGIAQVAKRVGEKIYDHYTTLGFGTKTGIAMPGEHSGFVNHPKNWSKQSIISLSYGYEISATLLQLACAFCTIANNGHRIKPRILMHEPIVMDNKALYKPEHIETIKNILRKVTEYGTGHRAHIKGYTIMTKTGTANKLVNGVYDNKKNIFTCAAIIEKNNYQRVIVTFINESNAANAYASTIATPLLEQVTEKMLIHERMV